MARHVFHEALREQGNDNDRRALYPDWAMTDYNQLTHIITFVSEEGGDTFDSLAETVGFLRVGCRDADGKGGVTKVDGQRPRPRSRTILTSGFVKYRLEQQRLKRR